MQIILKSDVEHVGYTDEIVNVKAGYARNYLVPKGLAIVATKTALKVHEETLRQRSFKESKILEEAQGIASKLESVNLKIGAKAGENGKIFGSVNTIQIAEALAKQGFSFDRKNIKINGDSIKELGTYQASIRLHKEVNQTIDFEVVGE